MKNSKRVFTKTISLMMVVALSISTSLFAFADEPQQDISEFSQTIATATAMTLHLMDEFGVPGVTIAIVDVETGFTWTQGFGYADSVNGLYVDEHTLFQIGSTSKPFTAIAIMQLVEQGIIDLDEPIVTYLPEFSILPSIRLGGHSDNITVRMLLNNTSGIPTNYVRSFLSTGAHYQGQMNGGLLEWLSTQEMNFEEGTMYEYANNGWTLLGILAARMTGHTNYFEGFAQLADENIFEPLGMDRTSFLFSEDMTNVAMSYLVVGERDDFTIVSAATSGGSMFSSAHDMARFMHALLGDGSIDGNRLLEQETIAYMLQSHTDHVDMPLGFDAYGLGFLQLSPFLTNGIHTMGHGGNIIHYHTEMIFSLENGLGVFVSVNSATGASIPTTIAATILDSAFVEKNIDVPRAEMPEISIDPNATPIELLDEEREGFIAQFGGFYNFELAGIWYLDSMDDVLAWIVGNEIYKLTPMSDGTFIDDTGARYSFITVGEYTIAFFQNPFVLLQGVRVDNIEDIVAVEITPAPDDFAQWVGTYNLMPQIPDETFIMPQLQVFIGENGMAMIAMVYITTAMPVEVPLTYYDGRWFLGFESIGFTMNDDGTASIDFWGGQFVRELKGDNEDESIQ
ncbi:MAG: beta-lactamase family protein [Defluviitaleaceae bacterium]|nr:beta-lactamase family protein [Defluviitaleaceae bacterium]